MEIYKAVQGRLGDNGPRGWKGPDAKPGRDPSSPESGAQFIHIKESRSVGRDRSVLVARINDQISYYNADGVVTWLGTSTCNECC